MQTTNYTLQWQKWNGDIIHDKGSNSKGTIRYKIPKDISYQNPGLESRTSYYEWICGNTNIIVTFTFDIPDIWGWNKDEKSVWIFWPYIRWSPISWHWTNSVLIDGNIYQRNKDNIWQGPGRLSTTHDLHMHIEILHGISWNCCNTILHRSIVRQGNLSSPISKRSDVWYITNRKKISRRLCIQREKAKNRNFLTTHYGWQ